MAGSPPKKKIQGLPVEVGEARGPSRRQRSPTLPAQVQVSALELTERGNQSMETQPAPRRVFAACWSASRAHTFSSTQHSSAALHFDPNSPEAHPTPNRIPIPPR